MPHVEISSNSIDGICNRYPQLIHGYAEPDDAALMEVNKEMVTHEEATVLESHLLANVSTMEAGGYVKYHTSPPPPLITGCCE